MSWAHLFNRSLQSFGHVGANPCKLHFAAHSHHPWPDATREAHVQAWDDAVSHLDLKWDLVFEKVFPEARSHLVRLLGLSQKYASGESLVFAPNTHELVRRLFSCLPAFKAGGPEVSVLTTDSEFYSFAGQLQNWERHERVQVTRVPALSFADFEERFIKAFDGQDVVFLSRVLFNSGYTFTQFKKLLSVVESSPDTLLIVDDYHGFCAVPFELGPFEDRIIYLAGGYKYATTGEGACFMHVPQHWSHVLQPMDTGWYTTLGTPQTQNTAAVKFSGATFDPTPWYRFNAVQRLWQAQGLDVKKIHDYVLTLERHFLAQLEGSSALSKKLPWILSKTHSGLNAPQFGHFVTVQTEQASQWQSELWKSQSVLTDCRGDRLRFGFGIYHTEQEINVLIKRLEAVLKVIGH